MPVPQLPVCLTIAGSDSGGGAGIQADLRAFQYFNTHGTSAVTAVTAQNPHDVLSIHPIPPEDVKAQITAVLTSMNVGAIKTGMLFSREIIEVVAEALREHAPNVPLVVDPVMVATSGAVLLQESAIDALADLLIPLANLITPNLPEATILAGKIMDETSEETAVALAELLAAEFGVGVLVKGGHREANRSMDVLCVDNHVFRLSTPQVDAATTHGTGCMLSSAIAANLALERPSHDSIIAAKAYVYHNLAACHRIGSRSFAMRPPRTNNETIVGVARIH